VPSSADPVATALAHAVETVRAAVSSAPSSAPVVLIDGRSGAGKSTLARALAQTWPRAGDVVLIPLDDLYPGWDGLAAGVDYARQHILAPHAAGRTARWRVWDWSAERRSQERWADAGSAVILEGAGGITPGTAPLADVRVWLEAPASARKARALARDGDTYRPHWERWAQQEERHIREHRPRALATLVIEVP
jgi:uridine kinase